MSAFAKDDITNVTQHLKTPSPENIQEVSLKVPEFWADKPKVWFAHVESLFGTEGIVQDKVKFEYVVISLDSPTVKVVEHVLLAPPENNKYGALKASLLDAFGKTQAQKDAELLSLTELGDMKPTTLLRRLRSLSSDTTTLFRAHFLSLLPSEVRSILPSQKIVDLDELAKTADGIIESRRTLGPSAARFSDIYVSIVDLSSPSEGMSGILMVVDSSTLWFEAIPIPNTGPRSCATALFRYWITRFGIPTNLMVYITYNYVTNYGYNFLPDLMEVLVSVLGKSDLKITINELQANETVIRLCQQLKATLKVRLTTEKWMDELPWIVLELRKAWREDPGCSLADQLGRLGP